MPANNRAFWLKKLTANKTRDRLVTRTLRQRGWRVLRIWEHELTRKTGPVRWSRPALARKLSLNRVEEAKPQINTDGHR